MMPPQIWVYRASVARVIDGDTIEAWIDGGFHGYRRERLRLLGVNAPEVHGASKAAGDVATAFTAAWIAAAGQGEWPLIVQTERTDDFGRYLANVWRVIDGGNLSAALLASGNAVPFMS